MKYASLFSGIEAASVAWEPLGWEPLLFSEVDPFASAVLESRFPDVPNLGDITKIDWKKAVRRCALGLKPAGETAYTPESVRSLADLIEPSGYECVPGECPLNVRHDNDRIDRERLLAIATLMAADSVRSVKQGTDVSPVYILHAVRNIAEACGETFGSKWGTSIVPKETIVDRDALLALADEMDGAYPDSRDVAVEYIEDYAHRIREACGEVEK